MLARVLRVTPLLLLLLLCGSAPLVEAKEPKPASLPAGQGIAKAHKADRGIAKHKAVLLAESFEDGEISALSKRWSDVKNPKGSVLSFVKDVPKGAHGKRALQVTATVGENTGGHVYTTYEEQERVYLRFYVKFLDAEYWHHFVGLGGYRPKTRWPQGHAGEKPRGDERFTVAIEPHGLNGRQKPPGIWSFYNYWCEMKRSADGKHWGNGLLAESPPKVPVGRWQCVEVMVKLNSKPELHDGELALWLDGALVAHYVKGARRGPWTGMGFQLRRSGGEPFEGLRWRTDGRLKANFIVLSSYVTAGAMQRNRIKDPHGRVLRVLFDHVVVATEYVGPIVP
jgi:hypothetical protein